MTQARNAHTPSHAIRQLAVVVLLRDPGMFDAPVLVAANEAVFEKLLEDIGLIVDAPELNLEVVEVHGLQGFTCRMMLVDTLDDAVELLEELDRLGIIEYR